MKLSPEFPISKIRALVVILLLGIALGPLHAQEVDAKAEAKNKAAAARGRAVYQANCLACHGMAGDGKGPAAPYLNPPPRDFTTAMYKFRSTGGGELARDEDLTHIVVNGVVRSEMPPFKDLLSKGQINDVVQYIKTFSEYYEDPMPEPIEVPSIGEFNQKLAAEGRNLYINLDCWTCHGPGGRGDGPSAPTLKDQKDRPIKPMNLTRGDFKRGNAPEDIYKSIMTGLDGTPMPAHKDALLFPGTGTLSNEEALKPNFSQEEITALKRYMASQPSSLESMDEGQQKKLVQERGIALVHYLLSIKEEPGILYKLFGQDTEKTK